LTGLCFFGIVALPGIAIHSADSVEYQHAGFWRGLFAHKNVAGPVMACFSFTGLYSVAAGLELERHGAVLRRDAVYGQYGLEDHCSAWCRFR
jgi:O-antigen ligase